MKYLIIGGFFSSFLLLSYLITASDQGKLKVVFCDVGQGDAAYIRTPDNHDIVIDAGPNDRVLTCLGKYMPFYDRSIDMVILSHPQKDHLQGLISLLDRYSVDYFIAPPVGNETEGYSQLLDIVKRRQIRVRNAYRGEEIALGKVSLRFLWPDKQWVVANLTIQSFASAQDKFLASDSVLGLSTDNELNDFSSYTHLTYDTFDVLFTGDGDSRIQPEIMKWGSLSLVEILKFPHHGSKTGILSEFLEVIKPQIAIISVGKNSYGHPTQEALKLLKSFAVNVKRTDLDGDIIVTSDGKSWNLDTSKNKR